MGRDNCWLVVRPIFLCPDTSDSILATYWKYDTNWHRLWATTSNQNDGIPEIDAAPYWVPSVDGSKLVPLSVLAFWGSSASP